MEIIKLVDALKSKNAAKRDARKIKRVKYQ
jgi:hypothetical protein